MLNTALIFYAAGKADSIQDGIEMAASVLNNGMAYHTLEKWVEAQNKNPESGMKKLADLS